MRKQFPRFNFINEILKKFKAPKEKLIYKICFPKVTLYDP